jgi:hypothetical protein
MVNYQKLQAQLYHVWGHMTYKQRALPGALLVGPRRTGTTSLYKTLRQHPNIQGAARKEIKFFNCNYQRGMAWYQGFFPRQATVDAHSAIAIEASPYYSFHPLAAERIRKHFPEMKILFSLRNPVDRAYSHYHMNYQLDVESLPTFEQAIEAEAERISGEEERIINDPNHLLFRHMHLSYLAQGIYVDMLERWFSIFPQEQIMVVSSEEFFTNTQQVFDQMVAFLGLPHWELTVSRNANPGKYPPMDADTREKLIDYYQPHNQRLYQFLDRDFGWEA